MELLKSDFFYELPEELIAADSCRAAKCLKDDVR